MEPSSATLARAGANASAKCRHPRPSGVGASLASIPRARPSLVLPAVQLQFHDFVFDLELFLLQPADLQIVGTRSGHLFLDSRLQYPVLLGKLREMSGKRHNALRLGVEGRTSVTRK